MGGTVLFDLVLRNGFIADGSGEPLSPGAVAIKNGKIADVGNVEGSSANVIDVGGQVIAPGFIDIHSHTDLGLLINPHAQSKITQGITTEVGGNCGTSPAPCIDEVSREELYKWRQEWGIEDEWTSVAEFLTVLERRSIGVNFATYVGHSNVRSAAVGLKSRKPKPHEMQAMRLLVRQAIQDGAFGVSTGLIYAPSCYADIDELVELATEAAVHGGIYASHIRNERDELIEAVEEALEIGRRSGSAVQISHHKACGKTNWGKVRRTLAMIDEAAAAGQDVTVDVYPYIAGATSLSAVLPPWAHDGGRASTLQLLRSPQRATVEEQLEQAAEGWMANDGGWKNVIISSVSTDKNRIFEGKDILQLAEIRGKSPVPALLDLLIEEELQVGMVQFSLCEADVRTVMAHKSSMIATDASARALPTASGNGKPHPRAYGTFPRVLGRYVRDEGVLDLPAAVAKMTSFPARKLVITDRGRLAPGCWADITVFDPDDVRDTATYADPHRICRGISYVLVNGEVAVDHGQLTGVLAGKVLRSGRRGRSMSFGTKGSPEA
jgi:N-acyl-D-amino-acid deacylase